MAKASRARYWHTPPVYIVLVAWGDRRPRRVGAARGKILAEYQYFSVYPPDHITSLFFSLRVSIVQRGAFTLDMIKMASEYTLVARRISEDFLS